MSTMYSIMSTPMYHFGTVIFFKNQSAHVCCGWFLVPKWSKLQSFVQCAMYNGNAVGQTKLRFSQLHLARFVCCVSSCWRVEVFVIDGNDWIVFHHLSFLSTCRCLLEMMFCCQGSVCSRLRHDLAGDPSPTRNPAHEAQAGWREREIGQRMATRVHCSTSH